MKKIILASASPRRIEMMKNNGFTPEIIPADIDETLPFLMSPESSVMYLALKKASWVISNAPSLDSITIAADTVVVFNNEIIGKPESRTEAFDTLSNLRNNKHDVITGVCIIETDNCGKQLKRCLYERTSVFFKDYSDEELTAYVKTSEPYDKAGGYAIQGTFKKYIDRIEGNYDNVVGFPWQSIEKFLK